MSLRASSAEFLRQQASQRASQPASQSGPLSALLSKENALKTRALYDVCLKRSETAEQPDKVHY